MDMYEPLYAQRPVGVTEVYAALRQQTYGQEMEAPGEGLKEARLQEEGRMAQKRDMPGGAAETSAAPALRAMAPKPAAPPPPPAPMQLALDQGVATAAQAAELGEFFEYAISAPVSLARQKSAMLPIVNEAIEGAKVSTITSVYTNIRCTVPFAQRHGTAPGAGTRDSVRWRCMQGMRVLRPPSR